MGEPPDPDADRLQALAQRDQLWASLRSLLPEIERMANEPADGSERERQLMRVLAGVVAAELRFRAESDPGATP
jgi:hypothetical protein